MKIKRSLLIRILKKLEDCSNWCEAHTLYDALGTKKEGESLFAHAVHLIQMGHVEERKNQYIYKRMENNAFRKRVFKRAVNT